MGMGKCESRVKEYGIVCEREVKVIWADFSCQEVKMWQNFREQEGELV